MQQQPEVEYGMAENRKMILRCISESTVRWACCFYSFIYAVSTSFCCSALQITFTISKLLEAKKVARNEMARNIS